MKDEILAAMRMALNRPKDAPKKEPRPDYRKAALEEKRERRAAREKELAIRTRTFPDKRFNVILCDVPWSFEVWGETSGMDRSADNHYPTMKGPAIMALDISRIAADDCVLLMWATAPMLLDALHVMDAWGFTYKSHCVWAKDKTGTGYWFRNRHELLLVGTKGKIPAPAPGQQFDSVIEAPRGQHSAKPEAFLSMIESMFPNLPKIELFRRGPPRKGWHAWGNEVKP